MANASTRQIASVDRYANALFQLAKEAKVLETVSSELLNLKKTIQFYLGEKAQECQKIFII